MSLYDLALYGDILTAIATICSVGMWRMTYRDFQARHGSIAPAANLGFKHWLALSVLSSLPLLSIGVAYYAVAHNFQPILFGRNSESSLSRPLADDSVKWQLASDLYDQFHSTKGNCHALMFETDSDYAVNTSNDLQKILRLAGCSISEAQRDYTLPKGLAICTWRTSYGSEFGEFLRTGLANTAHLSADHKFYGDKPEPTDCPTMPCAQGEDCMAVTVGNKPPS